MFESSSENMKNWNGRQMIWHSKYLKQQMKMIWKLPWWFYVEERILRKTNKSGLCHVMSCHVMSCHVMSCHVTSRHLTSGHVTSPLQIDSSLHLFVVSHFITSCFHYLPRDSIVSFRDLRSDCGPRFDMPGRTGQPRSPPVLLRFRCR